MKYAVILSMLATWCLVSPLQAGVYKWTDEQGRVHYSDTPPNKDTPQYDLRTPVASDRPSPGATLSEEERRIKQRKLMDSLEADRMEKEQAEAKQKQQQAMRARNCQHAQAELRASKQANLIYDYDAAGNRVYLNETQRQQYLDKKYAAVRKWCE